MQSMLKTCTVIGERMGGRDTGGRRTPASGTVRKGGNRAVGDREQVSWHPGCDVNQRRGWNNNSSCWGSTHRGATLFLLHS